ncbi:MAG: peptidoglycan-binding protein [Rhodobacteraceae bacterium]|nr:peptidoglycan-binding protein [Paracoccaceae bacterium]
MKSKRPLFCAVALTILGACTSGGSDLGVFGEPQVTRLNQAAPPGAEPGSCWGKEVTPAIVETVIHQVVVQPGVYKTETRQAIVRERKETWFQRPCDAEMTPEFIASLQRALGARDLYRGNISGEMDNRTRASVRRFQKPLGLDSGVLSLTAARKLGLVAVAIEADK